MKMIFLLSCVFVGFTFSAHSQDKMKGAAKARYETVVMKVAVGLFSVDSPDSSKLIQKYLSELLKVQSYIAIQLENALIPYTEKAAELVKLAKLRRVHGFVVGKIERGNLQVGIRSAFSGRLVAQWTLPLSSGVKGEENQIAKELSKIIAGDFPYRGYVYQVKGAQIQLSVGNSLNLKIGDELDIFDFTGSTPTFSSNTEITGKLKITEIKGAQVFAKLLDGKGDVHIFQKVTFPKVVEKAEEKSASSSSVKKFWIGIGPDFFFLDTKASTNAGSIGMRIYQVPLSPFLGAGLGYGSWKLLGTTGTASNASNDVRFLLVNTSFAISKDTSELWNKTWSLGLYYAQYQVTLKAPAVGAATVQFPLTSTKIAAPYLEYKADRPLSRDTSVWLSGQLYYPSYSADGEGATSVIYTSGGFGFNSGMRLNLGGSVAMDAGLKAQMMRHQITGTEPGNLIETQYGFFIKLLTLF